MFNNGTFHKISTAVKLLSTFSKSAFVNILLGRDSKQQVRHLGEKKKQHSQAVERGRGEKEDDCLQGVRYNCFLIFVNLALSALSPMKLKTHQKAKTAEKSTSGYFKFKWDSEGEKKKKKTFHSSFFLLL